MNHLTWTSDCGCHMDWGLLILGLSFSCAQAVATLAEIKLPDHPNAHLQTTKGQLVVEILDSSINVGHGGWFQTFKATLGRSNQLGHPPK